MKGQAYAVDTDQHRELPSPSGSLVKKLQSEVEREQPYANLHDRIENRVVDLNPGAREDNDQSSHKDLGDPKPLCPLGTASNVRHRALLTYFRVLLICFRHACLQRLANLLQASAIYTARFQFSRANSAASGV
jgi:hypothetical protein